MINTYKIKNYILTGLLFLVFLYFGRSAEAATVITDGAGMLTAKEAEQIRSQCESILTQYDTSINIVTSNKIV